MSTTLSEARTTLVKLVGQFPAPSTYATQLAILSDYFDNQIPLLIENRNLMQRIKVLESTIDGVRNALPSEPAIVTVTVPAKQRRGIECTRWIGIGSCKCRACQVSHA